jgi:hypothetical protein
MICALSTQIQSVEVIPAAFPSRRDQCRQIQQAGSTFPGAYLPVRVIVPDTPFNDILILPNRAAKVCRIILKNL